MAPAKFDTASRSFDDAQRDMRHAYYDGAPGVFVSGTVWLIAALVALSKGAPAATWALFIGGMFIHPVAVAVTKMLGRPGKHSAGNPLGALAMATTLSMIMCIALAFGLAMYRLDWFFPGMLLIIGGRYFAFATLYGGYLYWAFGATLGVAAFILLKLQASPELAAFAGAAIEIVFGALIFAAARRAPADAA